MKKSFLILASLSVVFLSTVAKAEEAKPAAQPEKVEMVSGSEQATITKSDTPAVGDPYAGKPLPASAEAGAPATQTGYEQGCATEQCKKAQGRWSASPDSGYEKK